MKIRLVERWGWSLRDIDETDIESLLPFIFRFAEANGGLAKDASPRVYCDQVAWL
jgi:hypothetical protein